MKCNRNFLQETETILTLNGKSFDDIIWIGNADYKFEIQTFIRLADFEYDAGYGSEKVVTDLMIVGRDWWLTRENYDGMEWWRFNTIPQEPIEFREPSTLQTINHNYYLYEYDDEN